MQEFAIFRQLKTQFKLVRTKGDLKGNKILSSLIFC